VTSLPHLRTAVLAAVLAVLFIVIVRTADEGVPARLSLLSVFAAFGYASVAAHYLVKAPTARARRTAAGVMIVIGAGAAALVVGRSLDERSLAVTVLVAVAAVGIGAYAFDAVRASTPAARRERLSACRDALIVPAAVALVPFFLWTNARINPVYDAYVYGFEHLLKVPFVLMAMRADAFAGPAAIVPQVCYLALPVGLTVLAARQPRPALETRVLMSALVAGVAGFALYMLCPAVGPVHAFGASASEGLPVPTAPAVDTLIISRLVPRNGMPSLHTVWALLIVWNAGRLPPAWKRALILFAMLNLWAAIGRYQHWFMDLVVAVPLAAAIQIGVAVEGRPANRSWLVLILAAITLLWLAALRTGALLGAPAWLAWLLVVATVLVPPWWVRRAQWVHTP